MQGFSYCIILRSDMVNNIGVVIGRPINGIGLNGLEYLLDQDGKRIVFDNVEAATKFLKEHRHSENDIDDFGYVFKNSDSDGNII